MQQPSKFFWTRRECLRQSTLGLAAMLSGRSVTTARSWTQPKVPTILVRSSWQSVNIGDIAHTPGLLTLLQTHIPEAKLILWPVNMQFGVEEMLRRNFPEVSIVRGRVDGSFAADDRELQSSIDQADLFLHGSGPYVVAEKFFAAWRKRIGKPYGLYGVTIPQVDDELRALLSDAEFVYTRETASLENLKRAKVTAPVMAFGPDATFAVKLRDELRAQAFLASQALAEDEFICIIPRLRITPYHKIPEKRVNYSAQRIAEIERINEQHAESDHAKLREVIIRWVRETGLKVLVCPEMTYQLEIIDPLVIDPLPEDVKPNVVGRKTYWLTDEATSVYARARAVISFECHSPILALGAGTPAFYLRQPTDTIKGQMYRDLGLNDWIFEIDQTDGQPIAERLMSVQRDPEGARAYLRSGMDRARLQMRQAMAVVNRSARSFG